MAPLNVTVSDKEETLGDSAAALSSLSDLFTAPRVASSSKDMVVDEGSSSTIEDAMEDIESSSHAKSNKRRKSKRSV
jgi:hypothetical protein